jgi:serine protease
MMRRAAAVVVVLAGLAFSPLPAYAAPTEVNAPSPEPAETSGAQTILVTLDHPGGDPEAAARAAVATASETVEDATVTDVRRITTTTVAVTLSGGVSMSEADQVAAKVDDQHNVKTASTATVFHPADTNWESSLWDITAAASKYGVAADQAWSVSSGNGVTVGVIDTGITSHSDLNANVVGGYDFVSSSYEPGDGDGWDSDPSDEGDAHYDTNGKFVESSWHGTHVAGTIAAVRNGSGVVGVAPSAKVEPLRVLGANGGSEEDVIAAIRWAVGDPGVYSPSDPTTPLPTNPHPVQVLNLSLGGGSAGCEAALQGAINYAVFTKGVPVVVAAGNYNEPLYNFSPANCANVIRVTASTYAGTRASAYSNYGDYWDPATVAAPGGSGISTPCSSTAGECGGIFSTINLGTTTPGASGYAYMWGTSMATPHVSGVLALLRALHPSWTVAQLTAALRGSATPVNGCSAVACGTGIVNATKAVAITNFLTLKKAPSISGKFKVGKTLKAKPGTWAPKVKVSYRWLRNGVAISKATKSKYKLTKKDKSKWVSVQITVTGPTGYAKDVRVPTSHKVKG